MAYLNSIFDNSLIIFGILTVQTLLFLTYLTIRKSVQKKLQEVKTLTNKQNNRYFASTIVQEGKKESRVIHLFMTIALVYFVTFLPNSISNIIVKVRGREIFNHLGPVLFLKLQVGLFALLVSPAIFDPLLTLYVKHDYREALVKVFRRRSSIRPVQT